MAKHGAASAEMAVPMPINCDCVLPTLSITQQNADVERADADRRVDELDAPACRTCPSSCRIRGKRQQPATGIWKVTVSLRETMDGGEPEDRAHSQRHRRPDQAGGATIMQV